MTTQNILQIAIDIAEMNNDNLVVGCLCVVKAHYITGEIKELSEVLAEIARKKIAEYDNEFPVEITNERIR